MQDRVDRLDRLVGWVSEVNLVQLEQQVFRVHDELRGKLDVQVSCSNTLTVNKNKGYDEMDFQVSINIFSSSSLILPDDARFQAGV